MAKSILQKDKECYLCRRFYNLRTVRGLERCVLTRLAYAIEYDCIDPPLGVHFDPGARRVLEQAAQFAFDELHGPGSFARVFGEKIGDEK